MLVIFDIDGTLCDTHEVDAECFEGAVESVTGKSLETVDWSRYLEATGSAIVRQFLTDIGTSHPEHNENEIVSEFTALLKKEHLREPSRFRPLNGAIQSIESLRQYAVHRVAIATGCWTESAKFKLQAAGFITDDIPIASCSDTPRRTDIIALAAQRARVDLPECVYVGDGLWDLKATAELGIPLIGVGARHEELRAKGASSAIPDFGDTNAFLEQIEFVTQRGTGSTSS